MTTGRYISDLAKGDDLGVAEFVISKFAVREYCYANELLHPCYQEVDIEFAPPTMVHLDKLRLYEHACPGGSGPLARLHYEFDVTLHDRIPVGVPLRVNGRVTDSFLKRGRTYLVMDFELNRISDGKLLVSYHDTTVVSFKPSN